MEARGASDFIAQSLVDAGVQSVFGGHGGALVPLVNAVVDNPSLRWVCCRNEANASLMAAADAKLKGLGGLAACIATSGPGASNLVTGLLDAQLDGVAVIAITGTKPRSDAAHSEFQDIDQARLFAAGGLEYSVTISDPLQLVSIMRDAIAIAINRRVCVHVAVPVDIQGMQIQAPARLCSARPKELIKRIEGTVEISATVDAAAALLAAPEERVVIAVGRGARGAGAAILELAGAFSDCPCDTVWNPNYPAPDSPVRKVWMDSRTAEMLPAPVVTRLDAKGIVDESHALVMGVVGVHGKPGLAAAASIIETATTVLAFGVADLSVVLCDGYGLQVRKLIDVAPDAFAISTRFRAEHTLISNITRACRDLLERLTTLGGTSESVAPKVKRQRTLGLHYWDAALKSGAWKEHKGDTTAADLACLQHGSGVGSSFCHPGTLLSALSNHMRKDDVLCIDTGDITLWASLCMQLTKGNVTLSSERLGTMGYALCAGIAASLERGPKNKSVVVVGDGGFQMTMNELGTAVQHDAEILIIVIDNGLLGRVEFGFKGAKGCTITGCDWVALAHSYGADGVHVRNDSEIEAALARGMAAKGVFLLAAHADPEVKAEMVKQSDAHHPGWLTAMQDKVDSG